MVFFLSVLSVLNVFVGVYLFWDRVSARSTVRRFAPPDAVHVITAWFVAKKTKDQSEKSKSRGKEGAENLTSLQQRRCSKFDASNERKKSRKCHCRGIVVVSFHDHTFLLLHHPPPLPPPPPPLSRSKITIEIVVPAGKGLVKWVVHVLQRSHGAQGVIPHCSHDVGCHYRFLMCRFRARTPT